MKKFSVNFYRSGKLLEQKDFTAFNVVELQKKVLAYLVTLSSMFFGSDLSYRIRVA